MRKLSQDEFIRRSILVHGDKFNYSQSIYKNKITQVKIICNTCKSEFMQLPHNHMRGFGCRICAGQKPLCTEDFISRSKIIHNDKYDYSKVVCPSGKVKVEIFCKECQLFFNQKAEAHLQGQGCFRCAGAEPYTNEVFIRKAKLIHGEKYDYSMIKCKDNVTKVEILCKKCQNTFWQRPNNHIANKQGCPFCVVSFGEDKIVKILKRLNFEFKQQYKPAGCRHKKQLSFDFKINHDNKDYLIEYQGIHHYKPVCFSKKVGIPDEEYQSKAEKSLVYVQTKDAIKRQFCIDNDIPFLEICYKDIDDMEQLILDFLQLKEGLV